MVLLALSLFLTLVILITGGVGVSMVVKEARAAEMSVGTYYKNKVIVLMYHDVRPELTNTKSLPLDKLDRQLTLLRENQFNIISMDQYKRFIREGAVIPDNAVSLTFDDGYESFYKHAYPMLKKHGATATSFIIVSSIDAFKEGQEPKITWEQMREMKQAGFDFYSHTYNSHIYSSANDKGTNKIPALRGRIYKEELGRRELDSEYEERIRSDFRQANEILSDKLGVKNDVLAFPYGASSDTTHKVAQEEGIDIMFRVKPGINGPGQFIGYRLNAGNYDNDPEELIELMKNAEKELVQQELSTSE
ncbi:polysaccharide deacetylase family protein [Paenibacillus pasadenensis]|nr:polysaccharide deacetylase family protein [Paenibacillus pasadenensis]